MSASKAKANAIVVGGEPRIDFLPPEIKQRKDRRRQLRALIALGLAVVAVCVVAYAGVTTLAISSQVLLADEQARTSFLLSEHSKFSEARSAAATVDSVNDARLVASATEIMWSEYLTAVQGTLPSGGTITQLAVVSESATAPVPASQGPFPFPQAAEFTVTASLPTVDAIAAWQDSLKGLPGFIGLWVTSVTDSDGAYEVQTTISVSNEAFALRLFAPVEESTEVAEQTEDGN